MGLRKWYRGRWWGKVSAKVEKQGGQVLTEREAQQYRGAVRELMELREESSELRVTVARQAAEVDTLLARNNLLVRELAQLKGGK